MKFTPKILATALILSVGVMAKAQSITGTPTKIAPPVIETTQQILEREATWPINPRRIRDAQDRTFPKSNNPKSPPTATWPPRKDGASFTEAAFPFTVDVSFLTQTATSAGAYPPDTMGAVGPTEILIGVNSRIRNYSRSGVAGVINASTDAFFSPVATPGSFTSDPRVRYDRLSGRWFIVIIDVPSSQTNNRVLIAVSNNATLNASTTWALYQFPMATTGGGGTTDVGGFFDYPTLGIDEDALYIGGNVFVGSGFNTTLFVVRKAPLVSGGATTVTAFRGLRTGPGMDTPQGVDNDATGTNTGYVIGVNSQNFGQLTMRRITNPDTTPVLSTAITLNVPATNFPIDVPALGSSGSLDSLDDRLFMATVHTDRITNQRTLWTAHNITVNSTGAGSTSGGRVGSRWYEIANLDTTPTLRQSGTVFDPAASNPTSHWIPGLAMNGQGHMVIGQSNAGPNLRPSISLAGRLRTDALGTTSDPFQAFLATVNYGFPANRWGDYSFANVDPLDNQSIWQFQMYSVGSGNWGVRVMRVRMLGPAPITSISPASGNQGQTLNVVINGNTSGGTEYFDPGPDFPQRLQVALGAGITVNSVTFNSPSQVTANITIGGAATVGSRTLTVTNPDGQTTTGSFTVNAAGAPPPVLSSILPTTRNAGNGAFTLSLSGSSFQSNSVVRWNGSDRTTSFISSTSLQANIPATDIASAGTANVTVFTPGPGGGTSGTLTFAITQTSVTGTVTLGDLIPDEAGKTVNIIFKEGVNTFNSTATLGASGALSFNRVLPAGTYDVFVKSSHWLQKRVAGVVVPLSGGFSFNVTLINGDVNGDNEVGPADFAILASAFGTEVGDPGYVLSADLDENSEIGPSDFAILSSNFGLEGDAP